MSLTVFEFTTTHTTTIEGRAERVAHRVVSHFAAPAAVDRLFPTQ